MPHVTEANLTDIALERWKNIPDPRLRQIMTSLIKHLHGFVREVELTEAEWATAIDWLTRTGKMCTEKRQEFILASDVLGVSMLVDAINHRQPAGATETTVLGPFYVENPKTFPNGADIMAAEVAGERLYVQAQIVAAGAGPLAGAVVDVWQSDSEGFYDTQRPELDASSLRGRFVSDGAGLVRFWSITPCAYPIPYDGPVGDMLKATRRHPFRPAHLHFMISAPGFETLVTHIFVDGDSYLDSDAVFGVKQSLIDPFPSQPPGMAPDGRVMNEPWRRLDYRFGLKPLANTAAGSVRPNCTIG